MPTLKSVASVTTGEPDTFFRVIACSSVMASSLWRITSNVIGSMLVSLRDWSGRGAFIGENSREVDRQITGGVEPRGLAGPDIDRGLRVFDDGRAENAETRRHGRPLINVGLRPFQRCRFEDAAVRRLWGLQCARLVDRRLLGAADGDDPESGEFYPGNTKAGALAVNRLVGLLKRLDQRAGCRAGHFAFRNRDNEVVRLPPVANLNRARQCG